MRIVTTLLLSMTLLGIGWAQQNASSVKQAPPSMDLHLAALQGDVGAVRQHIAAGTDLDKKDAYGSTPLMIAVTFDHGEVARALLDAGADIDVRNADRGTALHTAAFLGRTDMVEVLLKHGANKYLRDNFGNTPSGSVEAPFEEVKAFYDDVAAGLKPLGLTLDYEELRRVRPVIAERLRPTLEELAGVEYAPVVRDDWSVSTPEAEELDSHLAAELYLNATGLETAYSFLVVKNGRLIAEAYFNGGSVEQKALVQSVSKCYTSASVGLALEQGCLESLDEPMMDFFPELREQVSDPRKEEITIRHLLQMRAGYPWEESTEDLFELLYTGFRPSTLIEVPLVTDPGVAFHYSNLSSHLLGVIVARACNTDLRTFAEQNLLDPLGTEVGEWIQDWEGNFIGHGGMHLRARDLAKFGLLYLNDGRYKGKQLVPADWVEASLQTYSADAWQIPIGRHLSDFGYGYQWWSARSGEHRYSYAWGHGGQVVVLLDELDMVIVVTSDPMFGKHDDLAWAHEKANLNVVGEFISRLPLE